MSVQGTEQGAGDASMTVSTADSAATLNGALTSQHRPDAPSAALADAQPPPSSGTSGSTLPSSPAFPALSLATAGQVLGASTSHSASDEPAVLTQHADSARPSAHIYSSLAEPSDTKEFAQPVLIATGTNPTVPTSPPSASSAALLNVEDEASRSASVSPSVVSGTSTPARSAVNELHVYAQQIQQQLLNQHLHQQLQGTTGTPTSKTTTLPLPQHSQVASASASTNNLPPNSGQSSPNHYGSQRSNRAPHVLETHRLDIQTHTSGRRMVNQYLIEGELGRGVHGKVRLARDLETGERVAVKIVEREARKRLGAGLGLLNRTNRNKDLRISSAGFDRPPPDSQAWEQIKDTDEGKSAQTGSDSPANDTASASTTVHGVSSTSSTQFAPLPNAPRSPSGSALGLHSRRGHSETDADRRRDKERERARQALLWTTDQKVRREIAIMKKCSHDNVVQLKEVIDDPQSKKIFMVLEYMEGGEVAWKDEQGHPTLTVDEARSILRDVVCGLEYLHYQGIIHRDIKPANLLWDKDRRVKISDFGVSHFSYAMMIANDQAAATAYATATSSASSSSSKLASHGTSTSDPSLIDDRELAKTAGSPAFFAPELCMSSYTSTSPSVIPNGAGNPTTWTDAADRQSKHPPTRPKVTKAIDVWALGVTLYCLLFGTTPFTAESEYALFAVIPNTDYSIPTFMGSDRVRVGPRKPRWRSHSQWTDEEADAQPQSPSELCPDADPESLDEDARQLRDLLDRLLEKDPAKRITLEEVKKHPWVTHGLKDAPAWLSETDPHHMPFVEISHADVEDALTGFSKLKQRVKRWQSKLLDSFAGGRRRSRSVNQSSAASSVHGHTDSGGSSPHPSRFVDNSTSTPATPIDSSSLSGPSTSSVRTPRTPLKGHMFFTRQKSANSVGRRDGATTLRALTSAHRNDETDSIASGSPRMKGSDSGSKMNATQTLSAPQTPPPRTFEESVVTADNRGSTFTPMLPPPVLFNSLGDEKMKPSSVVAQRRASVQSTSSAGLRPDAGPEIPQRISSDTHGTAARRVSATSATSSSPQIPSLHRMTSRQGSSSNDSQPQRAASPRRSVDSEGRSSTRSISQTSRVLGRHRLGDFLRGSWIMTAEDRRSSSRPSTRSSREAPAFSSSVGSSHAQRSGSVLSTTGRIRPHTNAEQARNPFSIDTAGAVQQAGTRTDSGTPISAPVLGSNSSSAITGDPTLSTELLSEPVESASIARSAFSALSQPSSPLSNSDSSQAFAFDAFGRRRHAPMLLDSIDVDNDDVDLEVEFSDDDLSDDIHGAGNLAAGPMLVNSGNGWTVRGGDDMDNGGQAYLPEAYAHKGSSGSDSSNDVLTPSVEGGYNVFKPPYQHILSPPDASEQPGESAITAATEVSNGQPSGTANKGDESGPLVQDDLTGGTDVDLETAAPACQTFAMDATLSSQADALRKAELKELHANRGGVIESPPVDEATLISSGSVSRSASHRQHGSEESSQAPSAAETQATRSDVESARPRTVDDQLAKHTAAITLKQPVGVGHAAGESQFADADEDATASSAVGPELAKQAQKPSVQGPVMQEEDEDSDEQCISFQARRKKSTRFRPSPTTTT